MKTLNTFLQEVENLEEISKATLASYIKKGSADAVKRMGDASRAGMSGRRKEADTGYDKAHKRVSGVRTAATKLQYKEEVVDEGIGRKIKVGMRLAKREAGRLVVDDPGGAETYGSLGNPKPGDKAKRDKERAAKKNVDEGVMKFVKSIGKKKEKPAKKAEMDKTTEKLHDLRKEKFKTEKQKEHEKYVNFMPHDAHHESTDAFAFVKAKIEKEVGKDGYVSKDNPRKPQTAAEKAKVRAHQAKIDKENAAERAKDPSQGRYPKG